MAHRHDEFMNSKQPETRSSSFCWIHDQQGRRAGEKSRQMEKSRQIKKKRRTQHYLTTCGTFSVKTSAVLMYHSKDGIT